MRRCGCLIAIVMLNAAVVRADHRSGEPPSLYSRWNYWAPTLVRVVEHFEPRTIPMHAVDLHPGVPAPIRVVVYPNPSVPPSAYYRGTGLSYDPLGPFSWRRQPAAESPASNRK